MAEIGGGEMTLVFGLSALGRLREPAASVADARRWSEYVGVAGDPSSGNLTAAVERAGVEPDFISDETGLTGSLAAIRQRFTTDRHVFLGSSGDERGISEALGWEYLPVEEAAERAGWALDDGETDRDGEPK
jgi:hypothetical protein